MDGILIDLSSYIGGAGDPGLTLQGTLLNHTSTVNSLTKLINASDYLTAEIPLPFAITETNSLSGAGKAGISDVFGAALWSLDYNLFAASSGAIQRMHIQQGTDFRYDSWQPITTSKAPIATRPPYYGDITVATSLGNLVNHSVRVAEITAGQGREVESGYAIYSDEKLVRVVVINMEEFNSSSSSVLYNRPSVNYGFDVPDGCSGGSFQRLIASGSDAISGITFDGYSYAYELEQGKPVKLGNVTTGEQVEVKAGYFEVQVLCSSAVVVNLSC